MSKREREQAEALWQRQRQQCWICRGPIPDARRGTRVDLKPNYFGGKPTLGQLGLACHSCVARRRNP